jgi:hypothetical protein
MNDPVKVLMEMTDETVSAKHIAPILKMNPSVIVKYAKDGTWDADRLGKYVISGGHVKFFRKDFLQKCGFMEPEKEAPTVEQLLMRVIQLLMDMNWLLAERLNEKTAGAATPTD